MATKKKAAPKAKLSPPKLGKEKRGGPPRKAPGKKAPARRPAPAKKPYRPAKPARPGVPRTAPKSAPKPAAEAAPAAPAAPPKLDEARPTALAIAQAGLDKKAEDVTVLDVRGLTSYADYFVVLTADSDRQAGAIADHIEQTMKAKGVTKVGVEGYESGRWVLVDYGDVVAHVMNRESRGFYDLEGLWADAPRFTVS
jgi:ribosome-associated protein